jgi:ureidoacrylate peracid hydrolase
MHPFTLPDSAVAASQARRGKVHPFDSLDGPRTALLVIDMQVYFMAPGAPGEVPMARAVVPAVNRLAGAVRAAGGPVVWIQNSTNDTSRSWSVMHDRLLTPELRAKRWAQMDEAAEGHRLWPALAVEPQDQRLVKKRFSAFIQGASELEPYLRGQGVDTVLVAGTATNVCCDSSARDAMMLNFQVAMVSDALAALTDEVHAAALLNFYAYFGDVLTVDEVAAALARGPSPAGRKP